MAAFAKLLVLIAIFLSASNANAFTGLSPVAGNQVQENNWFQFVEPISKPTNEPTGEPTKTQVAYSEPKQDAELPSKITDLTNTQSCGLCHNNKSELGLLSRQPVQYEEEIIQSSPNVNAISQKALYSIQYASANDKQSIISARVLISRFNGSTLSSQIILTFNGSSLSSQMACWVHSLMVKEQSIHQKKHSVPPKSK